MAFSIRRVSIIFQTARYHSFRYRRTSCLYHNVRVRNVMSMPILLFLVFLGALLSAIGGIFLKLGAMRLPPIDGVLDLFTIFLNWRIMSGLALYFIPAVIWILLLRKVELSLLQPLMSIVYVMTPLLAIYFLNEHVSTLRWAGIGVIVVGVFMISRS